MARFESKIQIFRFIALSYTTEMKTLPKHFIAAQGKMLPDPMDETRIKVVLEETGAAGQGSFSSLHHLAAVDQERKPVLSFPKHQSLTRGRPSPLFLP
jgi:hypothetical protein